MVHSSSVYVQGWPIVVLQHIAFVVLVLPQSSNLKNMSSSDKLSKGNVYDLELGNPLRSPNICGHLQVHVS